MPVKKFRSPRSKAAKKEIHKHARHIKGKHPEMSWQDAHGVALGMVTGREPKKKRRKRK